MKLGIGDSRRMKINKIEVVKILITFYLDLHQGFWFLRPMDYYYPIKVRKPCF